LKSCHFANRVLGSSCTVIPADLAMDGICITGQSGEAYGFPMEDDNLAKTVPSPPIYCFAEGQIGGQS
jgi:hypothetical protein